MDQHIAQHMWEDYLDFTVKYKNEGTKFVASAIMLFVFRMSFDCSNNREEVRELAENCLADAWEWHLKEKEN